MRYTGAWLAASVLLSSLFLDAGQARAQQLDWEWYLRGGPVFTFNSDLIKQSTPGWTIQGGGRRPLGGENFTWFLDLGAGFTSNTGKAGPGGEPTSGIFNAPYDDHAHQLDNFFETRITDLQRFHVHLALGAFYPLVWNETEDQATYLTFRAGPRLGYFNADLSHSYSPELLDLMAGHQAHGHDPSLYQFSSGISNSGAFFGFLASVGVGWSTQGCCWPYLPPLTVNTGAELEFAYDIIDLGDSNSHGLPSLTPMLYLSFGY